MRKVAVVESGDGKHTGKVENTSGYDRGPTPTNPKHPKAREMHDDKRKHARPVDSRRFPLVSIFYPRPVVEPAHEGKSQTCARCLFESVWPREGGHRNI